MKKTLQMAVAGALLSLAMAAAQAATSSGGSVSIIDVTHSSASSVYFSAFDTSLGTLQSVTFTFTSTISGVSVAGNKSSVAAVSTVGGGAELTLTVGGVSTPITVDTVHYETLNLAANTNPGGAVSVPALVAALKNPAAPVPSYATRVSYSGEIVTGSSTITDLSAFTGSTPVSALAKGVFAGSGSGNVIYGGSSFVDTTISLTYNYAPVPEPETYGMLLAGLGLMGAIARRKAKKAA